MIAPHRRTGGSAKMLKTRCVKGWRDIVVEHKQRKQAKVQLQRLVNIADLSRAQEHISGLSKIPKSVSSFFNDDLATYFFETRPRARWFPTNASNERPCVEAVQFS